MIMGQKMEESLPAPAWIPHGTFGKGQRGQVPGEALGVMLPTCEGIHDPDPQAETLQSSRQLCLNPKV